VLKHDVLVIIITIITIVVIIEFVQNHDGERSKVRCGGKIVIERNTVHNQYKAAVPFFCFLNDPSGNWHFLLAMK